MSEAIPSRLTRAELDAELGTPLPAKEVMSLLDLNVDIDLALALAAPIDLAVAANLNVAAPIDAAVSANVLSLFSTAVAQSSQGVMIDQYISGEAIAYAPQDATITQSQGGDSGAAGAPAEALATTNGSGGTTDPVLDAAADTTNAVDDTVDDAVDVVDDTVDVVDDTVDDAVDVVDDTVDDAVDVVDDTVDDAVDVVNDVSGGLLDGNLVNIDVNVKLDADLAAPVAGAVAANANVAAPIQAAASANVGSIGSDAIAVADQTAIISQTLDDVTAEATAEQTAEIDQN